MDDDKILKLLRKDVNAGMEVVMNEYAGLVYAVVNHVLSGVECDSSEIEDCIADTFIEFCFDYPAFDSGRSSMKNYLCRIAKNNAIDLFRKKINHGNVINVDNEDFPIQIPDGTNLEEEVLKQEKLKETFLAIKSLGEPDSSIIFRKYYYGESAEKIAETLGMTETAVNTRSHRALKKLRELLEGGKK